MFPCTWIGRIRESLLRSIKVPVSFIVPKKRRSEVLILWYCKMLDPIPTRSDGKRRASGHLQKITKSQEDPLFSLAARVHQDCVNTIQSDGYIIHNIFCSRFRIITIRQPCKGNFNLRHASKLTWLDVPKAWMSIGLDVVVIPFLAGLVEA